jgi:hypothetical protein
LADFSSASSCCQFGDLRAQLPKCRILARDFPRQQELRDHEHRQQEGDDQQQLRHGIDEARPVGRIFLASAARQGSGMASGLSSRARPRGNCPVAR